MPLLTTTPTSENGYDRQVEPAYRQREIGAREGQRQREQHDKGRAQRLELSRHYQVNEGYRHQQHHAHVAQRVGYRFVFAVGLYRDAVGRVVIIE